MTTTRSRPSKRVLTWQEWTPPDLICTHEAVTKLPADKWMAMCEGDFSNRMLSRITQHYEYVIGLGTQERCLEILQQLGTDLRMKLVWVSLLKEGKDPNKRTEESVACSVIRKCLLALDSVENSPPLTKSDWRKRHLEIASTATKLAQLLDAPTQVNGDLQRLVWLISRESLENIADDLNEWQGHIRRKANFVTLEELESLPIDVVDKLEQERGDKHQRAVDMQIGIWGSYLENILYNQAPKVTEVLANLADLAEQSSNNAPYVGIASKRLEFALSHNLSEYFNQRFGQPLDGITATIIDVITNGSQSADSVKQMRIRKAAKNTKKN